MRPMLFLMLGILSASCVEMPNRPKIDHICIADASLPGGACSKGQGQKFTMTMAELNGHQCVSLEDAQKINNYVIDLQKTILELQKNLELQKK